MKHGVWLGLLAAGLAQAGEAPVFGEDFFGELPVVLTASRLRQPLSEAPNAMTVIDRKMIEASGFRDIPDLLKLVPGMYVGYYKGHQGFVGYHGSPDQNARRMQVMIDGRSVYMPPMSMVGWAELPITVDDIERIEVIRGPAAASHGANSTQGVISIITRDPGAVHGGRVAMTRGNKGINDASIRFGRQGDTFDYRMTVAYSADNGFDNQTVAPPTIPVPAWTANGLINNSYDDNQARLANYRANYHPNMVDNFDLQLGFNHDVKNVGWTDSLGNPVHNLYSNNGHVQLGWTRALEDAGELRLRYYHIRQDQHEVFNVVMFPQAVYQSVKASRDDIELQHTLSIGASNRLVYGAAYRSDLVDSKYSDLGPFGPAYASTLKMGEWRAFAHDEWHVNEALLLNVGGMIERDHLRHRNFSPRASLNFHARPGHTLRTGVSVAYRTPSPMESNGVVVQPGELWVASAIRKYPNVGPEKLVSREIGYLGEFLDSQATLDLRLYSDILSNGIAGDGSVARPFANIMVAEYRGAEATMKLGLGDSADMTLNYSHQLASSNGPALTAQGSSSALSSCAWNNDILSCATPRRSASMLLSKRFSGGISFSASWYFQSAMQPYDRGPVDFQPTQHRVDLRLAKSLREIGGIKGDIVLVVQNLFDQQYTDYVANSLNRRRAFVTLGLDW